MPMSTLARRRISPLTVLSTMWIFVPVFCVLVYLFNRSTPYPSQKSLGPENKSTVYKVNWNNTIVPQKTAYVYTYFSGRWDDRQRFTATLTSIEALRRTNTQRDIIVMVDNLINTSQIEVLKSHGAIVHSIPTIDLFHSKDTKTLPLGSFCYSNFAPIYAWSLDGDKYERVVWLDADVLPQMNMDELFLCGEFCTTYANLQWYIASLMVIKPSKSKFIELFGNLATRGVMAQKLQQYQSQWWPSVTGCQELFEEYLLQSFYQLEAAPLFNAETNGQQHVPMMRLNMGYCLNPIYWYEKYNWDLARAGGYQHMTSNSEYNIPGHSIGYPRVKPYDWFQAIYWNTSWVWTHWRKVLLQESFFGVATSIVAIGALWYLFSQVAIKLMFQLLSKSTSRGSTTSGNTTTVDLNPELKTHRQNSILFKVVNILFTISNYIGVATTGAIVGVIMVIITGYAAYNTIPYHISYYTAWPTFAIILGLFEHATLLWTSAFFYYAVNGADAWSDSTQIVNVVETALSHGGEPDTATGKSPYNRLEWELITNNVEKINSQPNMTLLLFIDGKTSSLSPLSQYQLISSLLHWKKLFFNILLVSVIYLINQYQIYPMFVAKIICIFVGVLYTLIAFVKPYTTLILIMYYGHNGYFTWRKPTNQVKLC